MKATALGALAAFLFVGFWLAVGEDLWHGRTGEPRFEWILDGRKVAVETRMVAGDWEYRLSGPLAEQGWLDAVALHDLVIAETERGARRPFLLRFFNASSWGSFVWVALGLLGQLCFFGRMFLQWLASEEAGESVVPPVFWWLSLAGGLCLTGYFVWRLDPIGVLGQSTGVAVYARNLWWIHAPQTTPRRAESMARTSPSSPSRAA